jgi:hypothetical protein
MGCFAFAKAQTYEIGVFAGGSNVIGDVGNTNYINPSGLALGGILKWNRSDRHSFRASLIGTFLKGDDASSNEVSRNLRGLEFNNKLIEGSIGIEFDFWEYDLHSGKTEFTPYLFTGISGIYHSETMLNSNANGFRFDGWSFNLAVPIVFGVKTNLSRNLEIALEVGARYTFTDNLDGSFPSGDNMDQLKFGNINNKDWFVFSGITVSYAFGRKPCYCNF